MAKIKILFALIFLCTLPLLSQPVEEWDEAAITQLIYQHTQDELPGIAVGLIENGQITYERYIGYADLEHKVKVDKDTRFNIASNAKQFTALCILELIHQGKIKFEDDFRKYLPDFYKNIPDKITISNLLTHTSGIRDYCDLYALKGKTWWKQFIDNGNTLELLRSQRDLNFKPGTEVLYSNSNYILLAQIVKEIMGQNFSDVAKKMFKEMDMPHTSFRTHYGAIIPNKARPYGHWNGWIEEPSITEVHGDGALFTTLQDQLQWERIIQLNDGTYFPKKLIHESQSPLESSIENSAGYGLEFSNHKGLDYSFHNGRTAAYNATFLRFPTKKMSIVVMSNNRNVPPDYLAWQIASLVYNFQKEEKKNIVYPENPEKVEKLKSLEDAVGVYTAEGDNDDGTVIRIVEKDGSLFREIYQRDPVKLIQLKDGLFEYETIKGLKMNFRNLGQTRQNFTLYSSSQKPSTYYRQKDLNLNRDELNGRFYNDETDTEIILEFTEDNTYSLTKNGRERTAKLLLHDYLRMMSSYEIKIIRDDKGNVSGLNLKNGRIKNVIFKKT
jgi:CubicO group peptidase (beta-lactamase class C family)